MGFSVSGSAAIIFAAMFIGFGMFYTATSNAFEGVADANLDSQDDLLEQQNTAINVTNATYDGGAGVLSVEVENTGSTQLSVPETDLLVDNVYQASFSTREVDGDATTDLWLPGETLTLNVTVSPQPSRAKVVTSQGVSATVVV